MSRGAGGGTLLTACSLANPLYVQAVSTLLPTGEKAAKAPVQDRCQGELTRCWFACADPFSCTGETHVAVCDSTNPFQLINSLSSSMLNPPSSNNIKASKAWSLRALQLADQALNETIPDEKVQATCERARIVTEFNLGMLSEVSREGWEGIELTVRRWSRMFRRRSGICSGHKHMPGRSGSRMPRGRRWIRCRG